MPWAQVLKKVSQALAKPGAEHMETLRLGLRWRCHPSRGTREAFRVPTEVFRAVRAAEVFWKHGSLSRPHRALGNGTSRALGVGNFCIPQM